MKILRRALCLGLVLMCLAGCGESKLINLNMGVQRSIDPETNVICYTRGTNGISCVTTIDTHLPRPLNQGAK